MSEMNLPPVKLGEDGLQIGVVTGTLITDEGIEVTMKFDDTQFAKDVFRWPSDLQHFSIFGPSEKDIEDKGDPDELANLAKNHLDRYEELLEKAKSLIQDARAEYARHIHFLVVAREARRKEQG